MAHRMAVNGDEEVAPGVDAEEGSADGLVRDGQLDLPGPAPVAVDVVGQRGKPLFRDAPVLDAQGDEDFFVEVVRGGSKGRTNSSTTEVAPVDERMGPTIGKVEEKGEVRRRRHSSSMVERVSGRSCGNRASQLHSGRVRGGYSQDPEDRG